MGNVIVPYGDDCFAIEPQQSAILIIVEFAVGAIDLGLPFLEDDIPIRQHRAISEVGGPQRLRRKATGAHHEILWRVCRSEEHTSELQSLMRISYAVFCLKKKKNSVTEHTQHRTSNHVDDRSNCVRAERNM